MYRELTIDGKEAWEQQYTGKEDDEPMTFAILYVFGEDVLGILMLSVEEAKWGIFEGTWDKIRESVELAP